MKRIFAFICELLSFMLLAALVSCSYLFEDFKKLSKGTAYKVESYFEEVDGEEWDELLTRTEICYGTAGENTDFVPEKISGFTAQEFEQQIIQEDESTVLKIYYRRNLVTITFNPNSGEWEGGSKETVSFTQKYGTSISSILDEIPEITKTNWTFIQWSPVLPSEFPPEDLTLFAQWSQTAAEYKVEHWFEKAETTDFELREDLTEDMVGDLTEKTKARAKNVEGFTAMEIEQLSINGDGSTVVRVEYKRNRVTLAFDPNGGSWTKPLLVEGKYGASLTDPSSTLAREDYEFKGWSPAIPSEFPSVNTEFQAVWEKTGASYSVEYWYEPLESSVPVLNSARTKTFKGVIGAVVENVDAPHETGYQDPVIDNGVVIAEDGSSVVKVTYMRKSITLTMNPAEGRWKDTGDSGVRTFTRKYGTKIQGVVPEVEREDYFFIRWDVGFPESFPAENSEYTAVWSQSAAEYVVKHSFESTTSVNYIEDESKRQTLKGVIDEYTSAVPLEVEGFIAQPITQQIVRENGSTVVNVEYKRKVTRLTFAANGGSWSEKKVVEGKYGATVNVPSVLDLTKEDCEFDGWSPAVPSAFPLEDAEFVAQWRIVKARYTVKYFFEKADSSDYEIDPKLTESGLKGTIGQMTSVAAPDVCPKEHFGDPVVEQAEITADGNAVVSIKYKRDLVTFTYRLNGGKIGGSSADVKKIGKYGSAVELLDVTTLARDRWIYIGWDLAVPSVYERDMTFNAMWTVALTGSEPEFIGSGDISLSSAGTNPFTFTVTLPYEGIWTYEWRIDGVLASQSGKSITETLSTGTHTIVVIAVEGSKNTFTKAISVSVE